VIYWLAKTARIHTSVNALETCLTLHETMFLSLYISQIFATEEIAQSKVNKNGKLTLSAPRTKEIIIRQDKSATKNKALHCAAISTPSLP
jgi:hypothetical protein